MIWTRRRSGSAIIYSRSAGSRSSPFRALAGSRGPAPSLCGLLPSLHLAPSSMRPAPRPHPSVFGYHEIFHLWSSPPPLAVRRYRLLRASGGLIGAGAARGSASRFIKSSTSRRALRTTALVGVACADPSKKLASCSSSRRLRPARRRFNDRDAARVAEGPRSRAHPLRQRRWSPAVVSRSPRAARTSPKMSQSAARRRR